MSRKENSGLIAMQKCKKRKVAGDGGGAFLQTEEWN